MRTLVVAFGLLLASCTKPSAPASPAPASPAPASPAAAPVAAAPERAAAPALPPEVQQELTAAEERARREVRSFDAANALGDLNFDHQRFIDAVGVYQQAVDRARDTLALLDELAPQRPAKPGDAKALGCPEAVAAKVEPNDAQARKLRTQGDLAGAWTCARQAAAPVLGAQVRRASALFMVGNIDPALAAFDEVLRRDPDLPEALFYSGALLVNRRTTTVADLARAQKVWTRFLEVAPAEHPRRAEVQKTLGDVAKALASAEKAPPAGAAGTGDEQLPAGHPPTAAMPPGTAGGEGGAHPAAAVTDPEKALDEAESALARGDGPAAAQLFMGVMNVRPNDPRMQAGLAASQFLKGSAMAERVFAVAAGNDPQAVDELAARLAQRGNPGLGRTLLQRLAAANPEYAEKARLKERMK